jgi:hypothetical protein
MQFILSEYFGDQTYQKTDEVIVAFHSGKWLMFSYCIRNILTGGQKCFGIADEA